jgi:hypothetical protein
MDFLNSSDVLPGNETSRVDSEKSDYIRDLGGLF